MKMNRREFLRTFGTAMVAAPATLYLTGCGGDDSAAPASVDGFSIQSTVVNGHSHNVVVKNADLASPPAAGVRYTSDGLGHTHMITLTQQQLVDINEGRAVSVDSDADNTGHSHAWNIIKPAA